MFTLTGAYGRDYKSKKEIEADLLAGKDFMAHSFDGSGGYINLPQLLETGQKSVNVRYKQQRSVCVIKLSSLKAK
jgi:hypothetical protein